MLLVVLWVADFESAAVNLILLWSDKGIEEAIVIVFHTGFLDYFNNLVAEKVAEDHSLFLTEVDTFAASFVNHGRDFVDNVFKPTKAIIISQGLMQSVFLEVRRLKLGLQISYLVGKRTVGILEPGYLLILKLIVIWLQIGDLGFKASNFLFQVMIGDLYLV